jgi:hypothetical protein
MLSVISRQRSWNEIEQLIESKEELIDDRDDVLLSLLPHPLIFSVSYVSLFSPTGWEYSFTLCLSSWEIKYCQETN